MCFGKMLIRSLYLEQFYINHIKKYKIYTKRVNFELLQNFQMVIYNGKNK